MACRAIGLNCCGKVMPCGNLLGMPGDLRAGSISFGVGRGHRSGARRSEGMNAVAGAGSEDHAIPDGVVLDIVEAAGLKLPR